MFAIIIKVFFRKRKNLKTKSMKKRYNGNKILPRKPGLLFRFYRFLIRLVWPKDKFVYLGKHFPNGSLIISNHASLKGPFGWEINGDVPIRIIGAGEMNGNYKSVNHYMIHTYYVKKNHLSIHRARFYCLFASPLTYLFYQGFDLISIRHGMEFLKTINDAYTCLTEYKENLLIFPEDAEEGYSDVIKKVKRGFSLVLEKCLMNGFDIPVVVSYCHPKEHVILVKEAVLYSELKKQYPSAKELAEHIKDELNELGSMDVSIYKKKKKKKDKHK